MSFLEQRLSIASDLELKGDILVPERPRGLAVLLHGIPSVAPPDPSDEGYPGFARRFAERGWAAAWGDMRGAREAPGYFSIEGWVHDAAALLKAAREVKGCGTVPVALVGSSAGGAVAAEVTRRGAPVDALVLLAAPASWISFAADPMAAALRIVQDAGMAIEESVTAEPSAWAAEFDSVSTEKSIAAVDVPVLVVHGTADEVVPVDHARRIEEHAADVETKIVQGAGHQIRREEGVLDLVLEWLERRLRPPRA